MRAETATRLYVGSEVGTLRRVMLHRPGLELQRLTPSTARELLFDGVLWVGRAREEHDAFAAALASRGVEIVYLDDLLADVLELPECARPSWSISIPIARTDLGPRCAHGSWRSPRPTSRSTSLPA